MSDELLVRQIVKNNNTMLFEELYNRYVTRIYNKCYGFSNSASEAEDLTQDVFLTLFVKLPSFEGRSKFSSWVYSLTYNFCVNYVNRNKGRKIDDLSQPMTDDVSSSTVVLDDVDLFELEVNILKQALDKCSPEDKTILLLKYQDEVSIKELCELMQIGESAVKMRLKRAKARVKTIYNEL